MFDVELKLLKISFSGASKNLAPSGASLVAMTSSKKWII